MVNAKETNLRGILEGSKQYQVPLYQRRYAWHTRQLGQLWNDVLEVAHTRRRSEGATHFIGSLVLAATAGNGPTGRQSFLVVDGQQRLTSATLLLAALRDHLTQLEGDAHRARIHDQFLVNAYEEGQPPKLLPTQKDRPAYVAAIRNSPSAGGDDVVGHAYRFFRSKLASHEVERTAASDSEAEESADISYAEIEQAVLDGLALVAVTAEERDNTHRIFESLNNTGLRLSQADLLKNYLFMKLGDRAEPVYESIWLPLEGTLTDPADLELLFWLDLVQSDEHAKQSETYSGQQRRLQSLSNREIEAELTRIARLGELLATILNPERENEPEVRTRLHRIRVWDTRTAYPVVLRLLARRSAGEITSGETAAALHVLEGYFVRRIVIGRATANLNRTLLQAVPAVSARPDASQALREYLSTGRKYYGTDEQVREAVHTVPFLWQGRQAQRKLILTWLEQSYLNKEPVSLEKLTVEHVLPQTLSPQWRRELRPLLGPGEEIDSVHEALVHTLGNLTLTGYNSEMGNKPFTTKRSHLEKSGLRLNQEIAANEVWGPSQIASRASDLAERIIRTWPGPDLEASPVVDLTPLWSTVAGLIAEIPTGRWTTYAAVASVAGTHPVPLGNFLANYSVPGAHRVLRAGGEVAPGFRWADPKRTDDQRTVLEAEGVRFDESGRAAPELAINADDLARLAGLGSPEGIDDARPEVD